MATQIFQNSYLTRTEILKPLQKMAGEQLKWPAGSQFVVAGKFYQQTTDLTINLTSLTANTLYMVYAVLSGGVITGLTYSTNVNSVGPVGASGWKLIGAFYANGGLSGASTPISYGSLVNITGTPTTIPIEFWGEQSNFGPAEQHFRWQRNGNRIFIDAYVRAAGSTTNPVTWKIPSGLLYDVSSSGLGMTAGYTEIGRATYDNQIGNLATGSCLLVTNATRLVNTYSQAQVAGFGGQWGGNQPNNATWALNHDYDAKCSYPVAGWSNTPLVDL